MFEQLKKAFSSVTSSISQKEITSKDLEKSLSNIQLELLECDIAQEALDDIFAKLKDELVGYKLEKDQSPEDLIGSRLRSSLTRMFVSCESVDLLQKIRSKIESKSGPFVIVFVGINGSGKTTTVAKIGNLLRINGLSAVMAAADTHRSGAIEQLCAHGEKLSLKVIAQRYGADPSAVGRDAVEYAKKHFIDVVLIDTAGRMQTSKNLMDEINKVVRVVKPDIKLFVGDSLAGNDTINQAREFFQYTNFDGAILTKADADSKGGSAISIVHITSKPILYFGIGQGYGDILPFHYDKFLRSIFSGYPLIDEQDRTSEASKLIPKESTIGRNDAKQELQTGRVLFAQDLPRSQKAHAKDKEEELLSSLPSEIKKQPQNSEHPPEHDSFLIKPEVSFDDHKTTTGELDNDIPAGSKSDSVPMKNDNDISITDKKKGIFGSLFSRKKKAKKGSNGMENKKNGIEKPTTDVSSAKDLNENKETKLDSEEQKNRDPIYLSDEDIEDLIK
jgi:fused signal recognition particle receptor